MHCQEGHLGEAAHVMCWPIAMFFHQQDPTSIDTDVSAIPSGSAAAAEEKHVWPFTLQCIGFVYAMYHLASMGPPRILVSSMLAVAGTVWRIGKVYKSALSPTSI